MDTRSAVIRAALKGDTFVKFRSDSQRQLCWATPRRRSTSAKGTPPAADTSKLSTDTARPKTAFVRRFNHTTPEQDANHDCAPPEPRDVMASSPPKFPPLSLRDIPTITVNSSYDDGEEDEQEDDACDETDDVLNVPFDLLESSRRSSAPDVFNPSGYGTGRRLSAPANPARRHSEPFVMANLFGGQRRQSLSAFPTRQELTSAQKVQHLIPKITQVTLTRQDEDVFCFDKKEEEPPKAKEKAGLNKNKRRLLFRRVNRCNKLVTPRVEEPVEEEEPVTPVYIEPWRKEGLEIKDLKRTEWFSSPLTFI